MHETSGGRIVAARVEEDMLIDADFSARVLPAIEDWVAGQKRAIVRGQLDSPERTPYFPGSLLALSELEC